MNSVEKDYIKVETAKVDKSVAVDVDLQQLGDELKKTGVLYINAQ